MRLYVYGPAEDQPLAIPPAGKPVHRPGVRQSARLRAASELARRRRLSSGADNDTHGQSGQSEGSDVPWGNWRVAPAHSSFAFSEPALRAHRMHRRGTSSPSGALTSRACGRVLLSPSASLRMVEGDRHACVLEVQVSLAVKDKAKRIGGSGDRRGCGVSACDAVDVVAVAVEPG